MQVVQGLVQASTQEVVREVVQESVQESSQKSDKTYECECEEVFKSKCRLLFGINYILVRKIPKEFPEKM